MEAKQIVRRHLDPKQYNQRSWAEHCHEVAGMSEGEAATEWSKAAAIWPLFGCECEYCWYGRAPYRMCCAGICTELMLVGADIAEAVCNADVKATIEAVERQRELQKAYKHRFGQYELLPDTQYQGMYGWRIDSGGKTQAAGGGHATKYDAFREGASVMKDWPDTVLVLWSTGAVEAGLSKGVR